ncbi:MAG: 4Fe-4S dicluster domain-containing protein [Gammaproteobacteria bacterium]|nr:4Fe-4S dicluster domain-containing protein [Gammaproteobacteria bacterium]
MNAPNKTPRWGMVVDLNRCVGCQTCTIACKHANDTPPGVQWRRVLDIEHGTFPNVQREFLLVGCQHCANPSCVPVCPSGATRQRADGFVTMDYDLCIGCASCAEACPYQARTLVHDQRWYFGVATPQERQVEHPDRIGVAQKCTFCVERVDDGLAHGKVPGLDLNYTPACAAACVARAIRFGDFNDPDSEVNRLLAGTPSFQMHAELGNDPQIKYLYQVPAIPGRDLNGDAIDDALADPSNPLTGPHQPWWDYRAAMNFMLGGMSSGLMFLAWLTHQFFGLPQDAFVRLTTAAGAVMAVGLFFVFLKIGRKARFLNVLLRPQSSWMTRETYFVAIIFPALAVNLLVPQAWLPAVIGLGGLGFLYCQAKILHASKGVPAWRAPLMPWLLTATGLLEGSGLYALAHAVAPAALPYGSAAATLGAFATLATGVLWLRYRLGAKAAGIEPLARREIDRISSLVSGLGHAVPLLGFLTLAATSAVAAPVAFVTGAAAIAGGLFWKYRILTRAGFLQSHAMPKLPRRGSGARAAPYRAGYPPVLR